MTTFDDEKKDFESNICTDDSSSNKGLPVDRQWLQKLLSKHGHDPSQPLHVLAPMVDMSDLPFRLFCRRYGIPLCFTPMIHTKLWCTSPSYRAKFTLQNNPPHDRPLIAQICGSNLEYVLQCIQEISPYCDGVDINCGCPQGIAKRGRYGAFLLEEPEHLCELVQALIPRMTVPLSCKVRLVPSLDDGCVADLEASIRLYRRLVDAGIHLLTIHGRTRHQKGVATNHANWEAIAQVVQDLGDRIPIIANGSIGSPAEAQACLEATGADGIMVSEAILEYPPLLSGLPRQGRLQLARDFCQLAQQHNPREGGQGSGFKCIRSHIHRFLHADMQENLELRDRIVAVTNFDEMHGVLDFLQAAHDQARHDPSAEELSWYVRHRSIQRTPGGMTINMQKIAAEDEGAASDGEGSAAVCADCLFGGNGDY